MQYICHQIYANSNTPFQYPEVFFFNSPDNSFSVSVSKWLLRASANTFAICIRRASHRQALHAIRRIMLLREPLPFSHLLRDIFPARTQDTCNESCNNYFLHEPKKIKIYNKLLIKDSFPITT